MSLSPPEYIRHMLDEIEYILRRVEGVDYAIVWDVATNKLSDLHNRLNCLLRNLDS